MTRKLVLSVLVTCLVCFGALAGALAANWKPLLGLDLRGGLSVVFCPVPKANSGATCATGKHVSQNKLNTAVGILDARANAFGVSQPNINVQGDNIVVQLPGIKDARSALSVIGSTAQLYFRPVLCYAPPYLHSAKKKSGSSTSTTSTTTASSSTTSSTAPSTTTTSTTTAGSSTTTSTTVPKSSSTGSKKSATQPLPSACPGTYTPSSVNGNPAPWSTLAAYKTTTSVTPHHSDPKNQTVLLPLKGGKGERILAGPSQAAGTVIKSAVAVYNQNQFIVQFTLTGKGTKIWDDMATRNYHKLVADDLGGVIISAPVINATGSQFGSSGEVTGNFSSSTANSLAIDLNYGSVPIALHKVTSEVVSPSLGASSLRAGLLAGLLGLLLVMIYTIFYYRALGIVVVLGLVTTAALLYGLISMLGNSSFQLTLDLSGVTGLIVSVGITVDSYVVYFERLKDEVRAGRSVRASVDRGFKSAYRTILSADAVSLIGAVILWWLSVGNVRGFAFMLGLSTIIDIITAYFFTRPLVILLGRNRIFTEARGLGVARGLAAAPAEAST